MDFPHQDIVCRGAVKRKWQEGGEKLVEVDVWTKAEEEDDAGDGGGGVPVGAGLQPYASRPRAPPGGPASAGAHGCAG
ncbi:MAG: hypothetical protein U0802_24680 [Candidatus Binatia bacterium]